MKKTNIDWIGNVPDDWETYKIGSLFKSRNEKVSDTDYAPLSVSKGGIVPQMENVAKSDANDNRKLVLKNDFVINSRSDRKQSCGIAHLDGSVSLINTVLYTDAENLISPSYTNLVLKNYGFAEEFYRWGHGIVADLWTTRWQEMKSIVLPLPDVKKQTKILHFVKKKLSEVDNLIANQQAQIEKLKEYKQSVITEAVTKGLDKNAPMKDSGILHIGNVPGHWSVKKHKYIFKKQKSICEKYVGESILSLTMNGVIVKDLNNPTGKMPTTFDGYQYVEKGNLLLCLFDIDVTPRCVGVIKNNGLTSPAYSQYQIISGDNVTYFYYLLLALDFKKELLYLSKNLRSSLSDELFGLIDTIVPPIDEQQQIVDYLDEKHVKIDKLITLKQEKIEKLQEYKKSLIYEYVTGKKEVV